MSDKEVQFWKNKFYTLKTQNAAMKTLLRKMHRDILNEYLASKGDELFIKNAYDRLKEIERVANSVNVRYYSAL